jgi:hypothetical protein
VAAAGVAGGLVPGSQWSLFRVDGQGKQVWKIVPRGNAEVVNVSGDGTICWFGLGDGAERLVFLA